MKVEACVKIQFFPLQKAEASEPPESIEPPRPEKKKTRKEKKRGASPGDDEGEEGHPAEERHGQQKGNKKVKSKRNEECLMEYFSLLIRVGDL